MILRSRMGEEFINYLWIVASGGTLLLLGKIVSLFSKFINTSSESNAYIVDLIKRMDVSDEERKESNRSLERALTRIVDSQTEMGLGLKEVATKVDNLEKRVDSHARLLKKK